MVPRPASYADAAAAECALFGRFGMLTGDPDRGHLLPEERLDFWTEHSERATLPFALASLGAPKSQRDALGRWAPLA